jgi:phosphoribosylformimino-5-aminoimidazole carboxamide ribotide isomerase
MRAACGRALGPDRERVARLGRDDPRVVRARRGRVERRGERVRRGADDLDAAPPGGDARARAEEGDDTAPAGARDVADDRVEHRAPLAAQVAGRARHAARGHVLVDEEGAHVEVIPVLDVWRGTAVHARGGDRARYRPVRSALAPSADPVALARAYRDRLGARACYLADLDALAGAPPRLDLVERIATLGLELWVDAGARGPDDGRRLRNAGAAVVVVPLETLPGLDALEAIAADAPAGAAAFSIDVRGTRAVAADPALAAQPPFDLAAAAYARGIRRLLWLDLGRVGRRRGPAVAAVRELRRRWPHAWVGAGGGVRDRTDLDRLAAAGADAACVATALHEGRLGRADLEALRGQV